MSEFTLLIINDVLVLLLIGFLWRYKSYLEQTGKELATKENIKEITHKVEEVKTEFIKDIEFLKASLQLQTNTRTELLELERQSIIELNEKYFLWQDMVTDQFLGGINDRDNNEICLFDSKLQQAWIRVRQSEEKIKLFIDDRELLDLFISMKLKALELLVKPMLKFLTELKVNNSKVDSTDRGRIIEDFGKDIIRSYATIRPFNMQFQEKSKELLRKILIDIPRVTR